MIKNIGPDLVIIKRCEYIHKIIHLSRIFLMTGFPVELSTKSTYLNLFYQTQRHQSHRV